MAFRSKPFAPLRILNRASAPTVAQLRRQGFTSQHPLRSADEQHYDPPTGWLFGVKPGEKYEKEGWESIWYWGFFGSFVVAGIAYAFKPDTSIQTWALEEARRRLEAEGILEDPDLKSKAAPSAPPESKKSVGGF